MTEQEKREKVIERLEYCISGVDCQNCEYFPDVGCQAALMREALEILRGQEDGG